MIIQHEILMKFAHREREMDANRFRHGEENNLSTTGFRSVRKGRLIKRVAERATIIGMNRLLRERSRVVS